MSAISPAKAVEDIELGSSNESERETSSSTRYLHNNIIYSRFIQLIKKIDGVSIGLGLSGGFLGGFLCFGVTQGSASIATYATGGAIGGFIMNGIILLVEESYKPSIIPSFVTATIAGCEMSLPMGAILSCIVNKLSKL